MSLPEFLAQSFTEQKWFVRLTEQRELLHDIAQSARVEPTVKAEIPKNPLVQTKTLLHLIKGKYPSYVRYWIPDSKGVNEEMLIYMAKNDPNDNNRTNVAMSVYATPKVLDISFSDSSEQVRVLAARSNRATPEQLKNATKDKSLFVQASALGNALTENSVVEARRNDRSPIIRTAVDSHFKNGRAL